MKSTQPEKILKMMLCSLVHGVNNDIGIVLNGCAFRISFVKRTAGMLHFSFKHVISDMPSVDMPEEQVVKSFDIANKIEGNGTEALHECCSHVSSFLCSAVKLYTMTYKGVKDEGLCSLAQADIYILNKR